MLVRFNVDAEIHKTEQALLWAKKAEEYCERMEALYEKIEKGIELSREEDNELYFFEMRQDRFAIFQRADSVEDLKETLKNLKKRKKDSEKKAQKERERILAMSKEEIIDHYSKKMNELIDTFMPV